MIWLPAVKFLFIALGVLIFTGEDNRSGHRVGAMRPWPTLVAVELIYAGVFGL